MSAYAVAMAFVEAAAVVYLRSLLGTDFPSTPLGTYEMIEIQREAATLVMLAALGWLAGHNWQARLSYFLYTFGVWDIGYYVWLKVLIDWPESFLASDVLFLIPVRWSGPVLAPVMIAAWLCLTAVVTLVLSVSGRRLARSLPGRGVVILGGLLALYTFTSDALHARFAGLPDWNFLPPGQFNWPLFLCAFSMMALPSIMIPLKSRQ